MTQIKSILPPNATQLQRDMEAAIAGRLLLLTLAPLRGLNNPDTCPPEILPWLAWAMSVDVWQDDWSLDTKKAVIRQSVKVHKLKGTIGALRHALAAFSFVTIRIEEWFEYGGDPFTFRVYAKFNESGLSLNDANLIYTTIMTTKNLRSHLDAFRVEIETKNDTPKIGVAFGHLETTTIYPRENNV